MLIVATIGPQVRNWIRPQAILLAGDEQDVIPFASEQRFTQGCAIEGQDFQFRGEAQSGIDSADYPAQALRLRLELRLVRTSAGDVIGNAPLDKAPHPFTVGRHISLPGPGRGGEQSSHDYQRRSLSYARRVC